MLIQQKNLQEIFISYILLIISHVCLHVSLGKNQFAENQLHDCVLLAFSSGKNEKKRERFMKVIVLLPCTTLYFVYLSLLTLP